jgi:hypothetical protein
MPLSVKLERHVYETFQQVCAAEHRSMAGELRRLIEQHIASYDEEKEAA